MAVKWTRAEEEALKRMAEAGVPMSKMTEVLLSRSYNAIQYKLKQMGLKLKHPEPKINIELLEALTI